MTKQPSLNPSYCIGHLEHELHQTFALSHLKNHGFEQYKQETLCEQLDSYYDEINDGHYSIQVNFNENQIQGKPLIVSGPEGSGKSSLLANWINLHKAKACDRITRKASCRLDRDEFIFYHVVGCSRNSSYVHKMLRRLMNGLRDHFDIQNSSHNIDQIPDKNLPWFFPRILEAAAARGRILIVIDGLHHMRGETDSATEFKSEKVQGTGSSSLNWLPRLFPPNVRVIMSVTTPSTFESHSSIWNSAANQNNMIEKRKERVLQEVKRRDWIILTLERFEPTAVDFILSNFKSAFRQQTCDASFLEETTMSQQKFPGQKKWKIPEHLLDKIRHHPKIHNARFLVTLLNLLAQTPDNKESWLHWENHLTKVNCTTDLIHEFLQILEVESNKIENTDLGFILGKALSLLFVARHGLNEGELFELLHRVDKSDKWSRQTKGTTFPIEVKLLRCLAQNKKRLIDIFRSFDEDGNGTLSHEEFYNGMMRLGIGVTKKDIKGLINLVDTNNDGEIDYRETLDHFEHRSRKFHHGKRKTSLLTVSSNDENIRLSETMDEKVTNELIYQEQFKKRLISLLETLGVIMLQSSSTLILPIEHIAFRNVIWERYIKTKEGLDRWHLFLIEYFMDQDPTLRRCEELPWHLKKCRKWISLRQTLLDLRTFDIMYNGNTFKTELFDYLRLLTDFSHIDKLKSSKKGKTIFLDESISKSSANVTREERSTYQYASLDLVDELNRAVELWYHGTNPSTLRLEAMIHMIAEFLAWFSEKIHHHKDQPLFMRKPLDDEQMRGIGVDKITYLHYRNEMNTREIHERKDSREKNINGINTDHRKSIVTSNQILETTNEQQGASYLLDRWIWIQYPWLALKNAMLECSSTDNAISTKMLLKIEDQPKHKSEDMKKHCRAQATHAIHKKHYDLNNIMNPSKIETQGDKQNNKNNKEDERNSTVASSRHVSIFAVSKEDVEMETAVTKVGKMRNILDKVKVELGKKQEVLKELQKKSAECYEGDLRFQKKLRGEEELIHKLTIRLEKMTLAVSYAINMGGFYERVERSLIECRPPLDEYRLKTLEQQVILTRQQRTDLLRELNTITNETEQIKSKDITRWKETEKAINISRSELSTKSTILKRNHTIQPKYAGSFRMSSVDMNTLGMTARSPGRRRRSTIIASSLFVRQSGTVNSSTSNAEDTKATLLDGSNDLMLNVITQEKQAAHPLESIHKISGLQDSEEIIKSFNKSQSDSLELNRNKAMIENRILLLREQLYRQQKRLEDLEVIGDSSEVDYVNQFNKEDTHDKENICKKNKYMKLKKRIETMEYLITCVKSGISHINQIVLPKSVGRYRKISRRSTFKGGTAKSNNVLRNLLNTKEVLRNNMKLMNLDSESSEKSPICSNYLLKKLDDTEHNRNSIRILNQNEAESRFEESMEQVMNQEDKNIYNNDQYREEENKETNFGKTTFKLTLKSKRISYKSASNIQKLLGCLIILSYTCS